MKQLVETWEDIYQNDIVSPTDVDEISDFNEIAKELGFENLCLDREANPDQTRLPRLNAYQRSVYATICPTKVKLKDYTEEMPMRALKALKLAKTMVPEDWEFFVWKSTEEPDPILVASKYTWSNEVVLIARWGTELLSFNELHARAKELTVRKVKSQLIKMKSLISTFEESPEDYAEGILQGDMKIPELKEKNID